MVDLGCDDRSPWNEEPMPRRRTVALDDEQRRALESHRDHHPAPAVRERCAALLKIADGASPHWAARHGLLRPRDPDTVYGWRDRYEAAGLAGVLAHRHGGARR